MRSAYLRVVAATLVALGVTGAALHARTDTAGMDAAADAAAVRELLEGATGQRVMWTHVPQLVILSSVMDFSGSDMTGGYQATDEILTVEELAQIESDLTAALAALTGGRFRAFATVQREAVSAGQIVPVFRRGAVVVGRFRDVRTSAGTLGFGGRTTRDGAITSAAVILDRDFDRDSDQRRLLRTHELGHALGFHHVESRRSVMNPHVGSELTEFDRSAIEFGFAPTPQMPGAGTTTLLARVQN